jgi:hypothetical protein
MYNSPECNEGEISTESRSANVLWFSNFTNKIKIIPLRSTTKEIDVPIANEITNNNLESGMNSTFNTNIPSLPRQNGSTTVIPIAVTAEEIGSNDIIILPSSAIRPYRIISRSHILENRPYPIFSRDISLASPYSNQQHDTSHPGRVQERNIAESQVSIDHVTENDSFPNTVGQRSLETLNENRENGNIYINNSLSANVRRFSNMRVLLLRYCNTMLIFSIYSVLLLFILIILIMMRFV